MGLIELPKFVPLEEAAARHNINLKVLHQAIADDIVRIVKVGTDLLVDSGDVAVLAAKLQADNENDELVSLYEAARRLSVAPSTVSRWHEHGWLMVKATGLRGAKLVSWASARSLGKLYRERGGQGIRLIPKDENLAIYLARETSAMVHNK